MTTRTKTKNSDPDPRPFNLHLRLPPLPRSARTAREALSAFAGFHHVAAVDIEYLTFALGEALANAIGHADSGEEIVVGFKIDPHAIVLTVTDQGRGLRKPLADVVPFPDSLAENGRGLPIMQRCTDFFDLRSVPGDGTVVTLGRYRQDRGDLAVS
jgi:anti-sigma regulatory factor (Ser/Thr protein kinase)